MVKSVASRRKKKISVFDVVNVGLLSVLMLVVLLPFYYTIVKSLMTQSEFVMGGTTLWPKEITFSNYKDILSTPAIGRSLLNTLFNVVVGVIYNMFLTTTLAYGLSRKGFPGRGLFQNLVIFTMYFSGGLIPFFLVVKELGLIGSRFSIIIPLGLNVFNMIILRNFFEQLPPDLEEAAKLDGAGPLRIFGQIILPLVKPALATIVLFYIVDRWNEWFHASLFLGDGKLWTVQLQLRQILWATNAFTANLPPEAGRKPFSEGIKAASVIVTMVPIMAVYPFLQKYFVKGVMIGAIKS